MCTDGKCFPICLKTLPKSLVLRSTQDIYKKRQQLNTFTSKIHMPFGKENAILELSELKWQNNGCSMWECITFPLVGFPKK